MRGAEWRAIQRQEQEAREFNEEFAAEVAEVRVKRWYAEFLESHRKTGGYEYNEGDGALILKQKGPTKE